MSILFDSSFYDVDYYENGRSSGKSWLENYRWMPRRSFREAFAYIDTLKLDDNSYVLDIGCAKGFIVKALRELEIKADGCDISNYALSFAPDGCWNCGDDNSWKNNKNKGYTHAIIKDVLEHLTNEQINHILYNISILTNKIMCVVPIGDNGIYRIPEYHFDKSHIIAENESWWINKFEENDWVVKDHFPHVNGLKDNWQSFANGIGNHVFILEL